jgi:hypothetical protein
MYELKLVPFNATTFLAASKACWSDAEVVLCKGLAEPAKFLGKMFRGEKEGFAGEPVKSHTGTLKTSATTVLLLIHIRAQSGRISQGDDKDELQRNARDMDAG